MKKAPLRSIFLTGVVWQACQLMLEPCIMPGVVGLSKGRSLVHAASSERIESPDTMCKSRKLLLSSRFVLLAAAATLAAIPQPVFSADAPSSAMPTVVVVEAEYPGANAKAVAV